jgi:hypothetical protein
MYRGFSDIDFGARSDVAGRDAYFELTGNRMVSLRGVVGKRLFFVGALAGIGYDRMTSEARFGTNSLLALPFNQFGIRDDEFETSRTTLFGSAQWTLLILTLVGEAGWQSGGDEFTAPLPAGQRSMTDQKTFFGSIALRLSI